MTEFQNIEYLYGLLILAPLALLFIFILRWKKQVKKALGDERLVNQLILTYSPKQYNLKIIFILIAVIMGIIALANLRKPIQTKGYKGTGIDVMIALDVSKSMLGQDEKPSRLEKAKLFINRLTEKLNNDRIGFVVFAGQAYLQMPLTADATATKMFVDNASPELVSMQGTDLRSALQLCDASLDTKEKKYKAVILITDGEDHDDKAMDAAKQLTDHGTILHTIGVGSVEGSPIIEPGTNDYKRDENGKTIISKLNQTLLQQLAGQANGTYHLLDNTSVVANEVAAELNGMEKKTISTAGGYAQYKSYYPYFLVAAVTLLIAEAFIPEKKKIKPA